MWKQNAEQILQHRTILRELVRQFHEASLPGSTQDVEGYTFVKGNVLFSSYKPYCSITITEGTGFKRVKEVENPRMYEFVPVDGECMFQVWGNGKWKVDEEKVEKIKPYIIKILEDQIAILNDTLSQKQVERTLWIERKAKVRERRFEQAIDNLMKSVLQ